MRRQDLERLSECLAKEIMRCESSSKNWGDGENKLFEESWLIEPDMAMAVKLLGHVNEGDAVALARLRDAGILGD